MKPFWSVEVKTKCIWCDITVTNLITGTQRFVRRTKYAEVFPIVDRMMEAIINDA